LYSNSFQYKFFWDERERGKETEWGGTEDEEISDFDVTNDIF